MSYLLFHFTARNYLAGIVCQGIVPQYIEIPGRGQSAGRIVSLTRDSDPTPMIGKSLVDEHPLSGRNLAHWFSANTTAAQGLPIYLPWTSEFRIHIEIPEDDPNLFEFRLSNVTSLGFQTQAEFDQFMIEGGGTLGDWYVYLGIIPAGYITKIEKV